MAKMVKLTDEVGSLLEKWAEEDSTSLAGEIKMLLDMREGKGVADEISKRLDKMAVYLEKKFEDLEATILAESAASSYTPSRKPRTSIFLPWENCIQDIYDDFPEGSDVWLSGVREAWGEADSMDMASYFAKNGEIWSNFYGHETPLLRVTPELSEYLKDKGFEV